MTIPLSATSPDNSSPPSPEKSSRRFWIWNVIALLGLIIPATGVELTLRYKEPMMRWGSHSVLVHKINHYKNRAGMKYLTISANFKSLPQRIYCKLTGQEFQQEHSYPEILTSSDCNPFLDQLRLTMDEPQSDPMWDELIACYRDELHQLKKSVEENHGKLVLMYVPAGEYLAPNHRIAKSRELFEEMAAEEKIPVWDLLPEFSKHPTNVTTFEPIDGHYRPFGHEIVTEFVSEQLKQAPISKQAVSYNSRPQVLGDLDPNLHQKADHNPEVNIYEIQVNSQGLRLDHELEFPKKKPRIAFYGDSMTIGYYVDNNQTWGHLLNQKMPEYEFILTGKSSCTLPDYLYSYNHHGKFLEADLVVLTFNDSDLMDMLDPFRRIITLDPKARRGAQLSQTQQSVIDRTLARLKEHADDPKKNSPQSDSKLAIK